MLQAKSYILTGWRVTTCTGHALQHILVLLIAGTGHALQDILVLLIADNGLAHRQALSQAACIHVEYQKNSAQKVLMLTGP